MELLRQQSYAINNQNKEGAFQVGGFRCLELVLYGIGGLGEQHYEQDPANQSKAWLALHQWEWRSVMESEDLPPGRQDKLGSC